MKDGPVPVAGRSEPAEPGAAPRLPRVGAGYPTGVETRAAAAVIGGRYRIHGLLGEGGMARVYDGFDQRLERPVAVKILRPQTLALPGMRKRFQQEARLAARLVHPNIVAVLDYGEDDSSSYLIMERLPGTTLRDEIMGGPMPRQRVMSVMAETLDALAAAHRLGVVHRDIKPSNILLQDDGHTKITDFGIAKSFDIGGELGGVADEMTMTGVVLGTPGYLAPERRSGQPATAQSDLYAVGAVMVEALTGRRLVPGPEATEHLPLPFRDVARGGLAVDPRDRFPSATDMLHALRTQRVEVALAPTPLPTTPMASASGAPPPAVPIVGATEILSSPPLVPPRTAPRRARRLRALVATLAVAALVVALYLFVGGSGQPSGRAALVPSHHRASSQHTVAARPQVSDPQGAAIRQLAASLANAGFLGDATMSAALSAVGGQQPGAGRQEAAQQTLALAQVLLAGGGITSAQYQDVVSTLEPTGASVPATAPTVPAPASPGSPFQGHDRGHGHGGDQGDQG
jgi:serine/threonine protein kinase